MHRTISGPVVWVAAIVSVLAACESALAQKLLNAITRLQTGDEMRYVYTLDTSETLTPVDNPRALSTVTHSKQQVTVLMQVVADTSNGATVDVTFEGFKIWMDLQSRVLELDLAGPAPAETDTAARSVYERFRPLVGTKLQVMVSTMGMITQITGNEALTDAQAWPVFRRYLDKDLFASILGVTLTLKSDGALPPLEQPWYYRMHIYSRAAKSAIWETRTLTGVTGNIATIKGKTEARGKAEEFARQAVQFLDTSASSEYAFDVARARLLNASRSDTITTRFLRDGVVMNSDLVGKSTLELTHDLTQLEKNRKAVTPRPADAAPSKTGTEPPTAPAPSEPKPQPPAGEPQPH